MITLIGAIIGFTSFYYIKEKIKRRIFSYIRGYEFPKHGKCGKNLLYGDSSHINISNNEKFSISTNIFRNKNIKVKISSSSDIQWWINSLNSNWLVENNISQDGYKILSTNRNDNYDTAFTVTRGYGNIYLEVYNKKTSKLIRKYVISVK